MTADTWGVSLYVLNAALLFTHQIDSAYWREWELFHLPGGAQLNLFLNFVLLLIALVGFSLLLQGRTAGYVFALIVAGGGIFAFAIHAYFLLRGDSRFRLPMSIGVLIASLLVSVAQGVLAIGALAS